MRFPYRLLAPLAAAILLVDCGNHLQPAGQSALTESGAVPQSKTASAATSTVPTFQSSFVFGGTRFLYKMVGQNPATHTTTTLPAVIVPVKLIFSDGTAFDPTSVVAGLRGSPIFMRAPFAAGDTQYGDALMRSEFWNTAAGTNYHVLLGVPSVFPTVTVHVPASDGFTIDTPAGKNGRVYFSWFIATIEPALIRTLGIKPTSLAFFSTSDTRVLEKVGSSATFGGYHDSFNLTTASGPGTFGTIWGAMFSSNPHDVTHVGHEVVEWLDDPFYPSKPNMVPAWKHPTTHLCDSSLLEVGDPVATDLFTINGYTFEDAVFLSWFSRTVPSNGIDRRYDLSGLLTMPAVSC